MAHLYYTNTALVDDTVEATITGDEARHAVQVARLRVGEQIRVSDGNGNRAEGTVRSATRDMVVVECGPIEHVPVPVVRITLVQALAKGDRDELAIQAATELGVDTVVPWQADRSISHWSGEKIAKGVQRWTTIVREASKQSLRARIPVVETPVSSAQLAARLKGATAVVLEPGAELGLSEWVTKHPDVSEIAFIVGPEGGISHDELRLLGDSGAQPVRLGVEVLRTSTAGPAAIAALRALLGQW